jgi:hypothetical protein
MSLNKGETNQQSTMSTAAIDHDVEMSGVGLEEVGGGNPRK